MKKFLLSSLTLLMLSGCATNSYVSEDVKQSYVYSYGFSARDVSDMILVSVYSNEPKGSPWVVFDQFLEDAGVSQEDIIDCSYTYVYGGRDSLKVILKKSNELSSRLKELSND